MNLPRRALPDPGHALADDIETFVAEVIAGPAGTTEWRLPHRPCSVPRTAMTAHVTHLAA